MPSSSLSPLASSLSLRVFSPAKINWALTIERKREDGFHDLHTIFQSLAWGDELVCSPLTEPRCLIECDAAGVPTDERNLVAKAWRLLRTLYPERVAGLHVRLVKRIPAGAGLGGGSSNAAAALFALNRLYNLRLPCARLEALAAELGSDCAFFIRGGTALASGRGEVLQRIPNNLGPTWLVVAWPGFPSPTAAAYGRVTPADWEGPERTARVARALAKGNRGDLVKTIYNVFSRVVAVGDFRYHKFFEQMEKAGLSRPMLSGSGSAAFGLAARRAEAEQACAALQHEYAASYAVSLSRTGVRMLSPPA